MDAAIFDVSETVRQAQDGDTAAFARIVRQYQSLVSGVLYSMTGDFHRSEDLAQETFLIAWNKLANLRDEENVAAWLCTIARNLAHRSFRKKTVDTVHGSLGGGSLESEKISTEPGPDAELQRREQSELVWSALEEIPEPYRETLVLFYRSGQSIHDIAEATQTTEAAVKQKLYRARQSLRSKIEEMIGDILTDTAPGDVFTFGVMAAVTGGMLSVGAGTALAGTTATTSAAASTGTGSVGTTAVSTVALPVATVLGSQAVAGGMLWASIRNTPTLRSRRLQIYNFFWGCQYFGWLMAAAVLLFLWMPHLLSKSGGVWYAVFSQFAVFALIMPATLYFNYRSGKRYQEMIEYELGLPGPTPRFYSFQEIQRRFYRSIVSNIFLLETIPVIVLLPSWYAGQLADFKLSTMTIGLFLGLWAVLFAYNYGLGKSFLDMCRDRDSYLKTPPLVKEPLKAFLQKPFGFVLADRSSKMGWLNWAPFVLVIPMGLLMLPMIRRSESPWIPGLCVLALVLATPFQFHWIRRTKSPEQAMKRVVIGELVMSAFLLAAAFIQYGFSVQEMIRRAGEGDAFGIIVLTFVGLTIVLSPGQALTFYKDVQRVRQQLDSGRAEAMREATEHFDPAAFTDDEPAAPPERFPKRWIGIFVLYGLAVAGLIGLGLHFPSTQGYYWRAVKRDSSERLLAIRDLDIALARNPRYAEAYAQRGHERFFLGSDLLLADRDDEAKPLLVQALADFDEAIRLGTADRSLWTTRAKVNERLERWEDAAADYTELIRLDPYFGYFTDRAKAYEQLGEFKKAMTDYDEAIRLRDASEKGRTGGRWVEHYRDQLRERLDESDKAK